MTDDRRVHRQLALGDLDLGKAGLGEHGLAESGVEGVLCL
jgi:hypothetical protein